MESWKMSNFCPYVIYRTQILVPVPPECWIFKRASLCYFLVSSYRSALFAPLKCNLGKAVSRAFWYFLQLLSILYSQIWKKVHEEDLKQTWRGRPVCKKNVCKKKLGNYNKCEFSNFLLFQWPKTIISVLVTWIMVDCNLAVRVVLSCAVDQLKNARFFARLETLSLGKIKQENFSLVRVSLTNLMVLASSSMMCCIAYKK